MSITPEYVKHQNWSGATFRHYKGGLYTFVDMARHSETESWFVVYRASSGDMWIRPFEMFFEDVVHQGQKEPRFALVEA